MEKVKTDTQENLFTRALRDESEVDALQNLLRRTVSGKVKFICNPYDAKGIFDSGRVLIFLFDLYKDFEKDNNIYLEEGLHVVKTRHSRFDALSYGREITRGLATNDSCNGYKFFHCTTTHDMDTFNFALEGVIARSKIFLKDSFEGRTLTGIFADYPDAQLSTMQKKLIETLYSELHPKEDGKLNDFKEIISSEVTITSGVIDLGEDYANIEPKFDSDDLNNTPENYEPEEKFPAQFDSQPADNPVKVADEIVSRLKNLSLMQLATIGIVQLVEGKDDEIICPHCGNGAGDSLTGLKPLGFADYTKFHCFKCGHNFDNLDLFAAFFNLDISKDFREILKRASAKSERIVPRGNFTD